MHFTDDTNVNEHKSSPGVVNVGTINTSALAGNIDSQPSLVNRETSKSFTQK